MTLIEIIEDDPLVVTLWAASALAICRKRITTQQEIFGFSLTMHFDAITGNVHDYGKRVLSLYKNKS